MSERARLYIANLTESAVTLNVDPASVNNFEVEGHDPSSWLTHQFLAARSSLGDFVEMKNSGPCTFTLKVDFPNGETFTCSLNQRESKDVGRRQIQTQPVHPDIEVWQTSGGNINAGSHGTLGIYIRRKARPQLNGWMGQLLLQQPYITLNDVVMPGSHDAGVYTTVNSSAGGGSAAETQRFRVAEQLVIGSRYFDFRVHRRANGNYHFGHFSDSTNSFGAFGERVEDALDDIKAFLLANTQECVILKWSHTGDVIDRSALVSVIKGRLGSCHYVDPTPDGVSPPPSSVLARRELSVFSGHALSVFDTEFDSQLGADSQLFAYHDTAEGATRGDMNQTAASKESAGLTVLDRYAKNVDADVVCPDQKNKLVTQGGQGNNYLFLLSWFATGTAGNTDIRALAHTMHPRLPEFLHWIADAGQNRPNVVYLDFIDEDLCSLIVALNDAPTLDAGTTYFIEPGGRYGKALDTYGTSPHAAFLQENSLRSSGMHWHFELNPANGSYFLQNDFQPGMALTVGQQQLVLSPLDRKSESQMWKIRKDVMGGVRFESVLYGSDCFVNIGANEVPQLVSTTKVLLNMWKLVQA